MITRNFENILALIYPLTPASTSPNYQTPLMDVSGRYLFASPCIANNVFPANITYSFTTNSSSAGISIGSGTTPASADDYNLENTTTSGITGTVSSVTIGYDSFGSPYTTFVLAVTNTGENPITVSEIGYKQTVRASTGVKTGSISSFAILFDRTVLSMPVTIQGNDTGIIKYELKTSLNRHPESKAGVKLASFTHGTDEEISAMIDAAHRGDIDLQLDAGWRVGDYRTIHIDEFSATSQVSSQDIDIVISDFSDYNSCGNVLQFDFVNALDASGLKMNLQNTAVSYDNTEMFTLTLPALVNALPEWLRNRLITFDVQAAVSYNSEDIKLVSNNKIALRSEVEICGQTTYSISGEGSQVGYYKLAKVASTKSKGKNGNVQSYWTRSIGKNQSIQYCTITGAGMPGLSQLNNTSTSVAPFGCL